MMKGIVAVLDGNSQQKIEQIWSEFIDIFGVHGVSQAPYPHFSFHVAQDYAGHALDLTLMKIAAETGSFTVKTSGLILFTGSMPVVAVNVVCDQDLLLLHRQIWDSVTPVANAVNAYYAPNSWVPHITLAHGDFKPDQIPAVLARLQARDFGWTISVECIAVLENHAVSPQQTYELKRS